jgi:hypothetical protein
MTTDDTNGSVRITNADIYRLVSDMRDKLNLLDQSVRDSIKPKLETALTRLDAIDKSKADKDSVTELRGRLATVEMRIFGVLAGLVAAAIAGRNVGII